MSIKYVLIKHQTKRSHRSGIQRSSWKHDPNCIGVTSCWISAHQRQFCSQKAVSY